MRPSRPMLVADQGIVLAFFFSYFLGDLLVTMPSTRQYGECNDKCDINKKHRIAGYCRHKQEPLLENAMTSRPNCTGVLVFLGFIDIVLVRTPGHSEADPPLRHSHSQLRAMISSAVTICTLSLWCTWYQLTTTGDGIGRSVRLR